MIEMVEFKAKHLRTINPQEAQIHLQPELTQPGYADDLEKAGPAYTALLEGRPVMCAGIVPVWGHRAMAWALLTSDCSGHMVQLHRAVKRFLDVCGVRRVETAVDCEFPEGHRWARLLGFKMEAERMKAYSPDGRDCALYARVTRG